jgi:hypothetical protein
VIATDVPPPEPAIPRFSRIRSESSSEKVRHETVLLDSLARLRLLCRVKISDLDLIPRSLVRARFGLIFGSAPLFRPLLGAFLCAAPFAAAQDISATITSANAPSGTPTSPHFVIDSDGSNADPGYDRDSIPASVEVEFNWEGGLSSGSDDFRATAQLIGPDGNAVDLANGGTTLASSSQTVSLSAFSFTTTRTFTLDPAPDVDLGAGERYSLRYRVQRWTEGSINGFPIFFWQTVAGPEDSSSFTVVHFADDPEDPDARYARGYLRGAPSWTKKFAIQTGSNTTARNFAVRVPYTLARYDIGGSSAFIGVRFIVAMEDDLGNPVPLIDDGVTTAAFSRAAFNSGTPNTPAIGSFNRTVRFAPAGQLDARNRTYKVRIRFEHLEIPSTNTYRDNGTSPDGAFEQLLDFNGNLRFGPASGGLVTTFSAISNSPAPGTSGSNYVNTTLNVTHGSIPGFPDYGFGDGSALDVRLFTNGDSVVTAGSQPVTVSGGGDVESDFNGVTVVYPDTVLTNNGPITGEAVIRLPQGLSYTPSRSNSAGRYRSEVTIPGPHTLTDQLRHSGDLSLGLPADAWVFDESRPLLYQVNGIVLDQSGEIDFNAADSEWAHKRAFDQLESQQANGLHDDPAMAIRLSNDGYFRFGRLGIANSVRFAAAADGTIRCLAADLAVDPGNFGTHFPLDTPVKWNSPGEIKIRDGLIHSDSVLPNAENLRVAFDGSCADDPCGPGGGAVETLAIEPKNGDLHPTSDGGLQAPGKITPTNLAWGIRGDLTFTHRTDEFTAAHFLAGGHQLYEALNPVAAGGPQQSVAGDLGPGVITLAGFNPANPGLPVYAETADYRDGAGVWPGATVTVGNAGHVGASRLADQTSDYPYVLQQQVSKYYVRRSGVSGRHVAEEESFDPNLELYGYNFTLSRFQLTFLSNENEDSWINGVVVVPNPSDFKQSFEELALSCVGALEDAKIDPDDAGAKPLAYWNGSFTPLAMRFAPEAGAGCYADRFLTLGVISGAANIPSPLAGTLAFMPTGNIGTLADNVEGADGRLGLPATVPFDGPGSEQYPLHPVTKLYFSNPEASGAPAKGFVSFGATCGVPYFEDLDVHVMTSAQAGVPASVFLASNWEISGESHFTNTKFDETHRGFPSGITADNYQNPSSATAYLVHAKQSIFGIVSLDYPLRWSPTARFFESWEAEQNELLVIDVEHQIDYLSAENAEISFGAQYEGLPKISLASAATEVVDGQLGAARALTEAAQSFVTDTLNEGVDEIGNLVNDSMESVLDRALDEIEKEAIDPLYEEIVTAYGDAVAANQTYDDWLNQGSGNLKQVFDQYLDGTLGDPADSIKGRLQMLSDANAEASSLVLRVRDAVDSGILAIDSIAGEIQTYRNASDEVVVALQAPPGFTADELVNGLLAEVPGPDGPERQIVQALVRELINELAPPDLAAVLNPLLADASSEINDRLNELLEEFDPTLDRVTEVLMEARGYLVEVRDKLNEGAEIFNSFDQILTDAETEIDNLMDGIRSTAYGFIDRMVASAALPTNTALDDVGNVLDEFDKEEFVALIRAELRDRLLATDFIQSIQYQLRQTISEFDIALRSAIDSAFAEVNRLCRELIKEALGPIDDAINGLVGDINSVVGAGSLDGYAHIQGDTLRRLRIDAMVELKVPDDLKLQAYFEMLCYDSETDTGSAGCLEPGEQVVEVRIGAVDVPLDWISPDLRANLDVWFSMQTAPNVRPKGIGGGFTMTGGELNFQAFKITAFAAGVAVGSDEAYIAAAATVIVSNYEASGGIFFGRTCSLAPLEMVDPDVAEVLGDPPFTGAYVYGEVWLPISEALLGIPASCFFRISAGVGAGAFYFVEGATYGGKMLLGASGEALCLVSIKGTLTMIGVMRDGSLAFSGKGRIKGKAGACPFCVKFGKTVKVKYVDDKWSVDL